MIFSNDTELYIVYKKIEDPVIVSRRWELHEENLSFSSAYYCEWIARERERQIETERKGNENRGCRASSMDSTANTYSL